MTLDVNSFLSEYIEESLENLDKIYDGLSLLTKKHDDKESLELLLRVLHTVKGTSRMMGFSYVEEIAHKLEDVYKLVQNGNFGMTNRLAQLSFSILKILREYISKLDSNEKPEISQYSEIIKNLEFAEKGEEFKTDFLYLEESEKDETLEEK